MKTKSFSLLLTLLISLALSACAGGVRSPAPAAEEEEYQGTVVESESVTGEAMTSEAYGPETPEGSPVPPEAAPDVQAPPEAPKLCLVLGPGMARALAHAAVLEAIRKADLPVHCVVGTEMGAVVGALYSMSNGGTNNLQWQLFKFNQDNYFNFPMLSLREPKSSGRHLHDFLREIFRQRKIESLPIRFATSATNAESGRAVSFEKGDLADALSATLAMPGIFDAWKVGGTSFVSGAVSSPAPMDLARSLGGNFIVLVDVMAGKEGGSDRFQRAFLPVRSLLRLQKREASFVISVDASAAPFDGFGRQGEILAAGARAAENSVPELKAAWEKWIAGQK